MKRVRTAESRDIRNIQRYTSQDEQASLCFTFGQFQMRSIDIHGEFNNCYKDEAQFIEKISNFIGRALPLLSKEDVRLFTTDPRLSRKDRCSMNTARFMKITSVNGWIISELASRLSF